jgi:hypothetical protein
VLRVRDIPFLAGDDFDRAFERLAPRWGGAKSLGRRSRARVLQLKRDGDPLATLIRLFVAGVTVPLEDGRRAVDPQTGILAASPIR